MAIQTQYSTTAAQTGRTPSAPVDPVAATAALMTGMPKCEVERLTRGLVDALARQFRVPCPRCKGSGEELLFMRFHTCEVCAGDKRVSEETAREEIARRERGG